MDNIKERVIITGASSGIGRALAVEYGRKGADVLLLARNEEQLKITEQMLESKGGRGFVRVCDVSEQENLNSAVEFAIKTFGRIDIAIFNAGISGDDKIENMSADKFRQIIEVNFFGVVYGINAILPLMKKQGFGKIVGMGSLADFRGMPDVSAYSSSKAALSNYLDSARIEFKKYGIRVITVKPGFVKSGITDLNDYYMPMIMEADKAAKIIVRKIEKNIPVIRFPKLIMLGTLIGKMVPVKFFDWIITRFKTTATNI